MDSKYLLRLSEPIRKLVTEIEEFASIEIKVQVLEQLRTNLNNAAGDFNCASGTIFIGDESAFANESILPFLFRAKRYWIDGIPQIVPLENDPDKWRITGSIELAVERIITIPQEAHYGINSLQFLEAEVRRNWQQGQLLTGNEWARRKNLLLGYLTVATFVKDESLLTFVEGVLSREGYLPIAKSFNNEIVSNINSKEKVLELVVRYLNIPKQEVAMRYCDVKNRRSEDRPVTDKGRKKPSGKIGITEIKAEEGKQSSTFLPVSFPDIKDSIEFTITSSFIRNASKNGYFSFEILEVHQNNENHLDFELTTNEGKKFLELMEIAPLEKSKSFASSPADYKPYELAQYVLEKLMTKSKKYVGVKKTGIVLLLYITDWKFIFSETLIALLQFCTLGNKHTFEYIYLYQPMTDVAGMTHLIYPTPPEYWAEFDPELYKDNSTTNLNPTGWRPE
jgi:hypothetical protein